MRCWHCGNHVIWDCDFSNEDFDIEEESIVTIMHCPECKCKYQLTLPINHKEEEEEIPYGTKVLAWDLEYEDCVEALYVNKDKTRSCPHGVIINSNGILKVEYFTYVEKINTGKMEE